MREALRELGHELDEREVVRELQRYDRNGNGLLELAEFLQLAAELGRGQRGWSDSDIRAAFRRFDANNSGKLDYKELRTALRGLGVDVNEREAVRVLQSYDGDGNGLMELDEFSRLVRQIHIRGRRGSSSKWTDADVRRAFHKYDSNSSGKLDYKELRGALQDLGLRHDTDEAVRVLREFDRSGDGLLSLDEFGKLVRQLADGAASALPLPSELPPALPPGWVETTEPGSLRVYYYNRETRQAQWHRPGTATPLQP